jgi:hypothetical protein
MRRWPVLLLAATGLAFPACKKDHVESKVIHGAPVVTSQDVIAVRAAQQMHLLTRDITNVTVLVVSRIGLVPPVDPPELTPLNDGSMKYAFTVSNPHYGNFTGTMQFFDANGTYDPIPPTASTSPLTSVTIQSTSGGSSLFAFNGTWVCTLQAEGATRSFKNITATTDFTGQGYAINFTIPSPGADADVSGLGTGNLNGTGTGPTAPATFALTYQTDASANGLMTWEGNEAPLHLDPNGSAFIVTEGQRIVFE